MPRPRSQRPAYQYHISGQAVVALNGRDFYLGKHNSPESNARYLELLSIYQANGLRIPDSTPTHQQETPISVGQVLGEWKEHVTGRSDLIRYKPLLDILEMEYASLPATEFGSRCLKEVCDTLLADGKQSRKWINEQVRAAGRIFKHGASVELIGFDVYNKLTTLEALKRGYTTAREQAPRQPVPLADIAATVAELTPVMAAMVRIQLATGMRSGEVCRMRPCDIDKSGPEWIYRHSESYCFSPTESDEWHRSMRRNKRITPLKYEKREFAYDRTTVRSQMSTRKSSVRLPRVLRKTTPAKRFGELEFTIKTSNHGWTTHVTANWVFR